MRTQKELRAKRNKTTRKDLLLQDQSGKTGKPKIFKDRVQEQTIIKTYDMRVLNDVKTEDLE